MFVLLCEYSGWGWWLSINIYLIAWWNLSLFTMYRWIILFLKQRLLTMPIWHQLKLRQGWDTKGASFHRSSMRSSHRWRGRTVHVLKCEPSRPESRKMCAQTCRDKEDVCTDMQRQGRCVHRHGYTHDVCTDTDTHTMCTQTRIHTQLSF